MFEIYSKREKLHSDGVLKQVYEILAICCLVLIYQYQLIESVMINNLCHKMTLHTCILYTLFLKMAGDMCYIDGCKVFMTIFKYSQKKPDIADQKESMQ